MTRGTCGVPSLRGMCVVSILAGLFCIVMIFFFFFQAEDGIRDYKVTGVQTCALPICPARGVSLSGMGTALAGYVGPVSRPLFVAAARDPFAGLAPNRRPRTFTQRQRDRKSVV